MSFYYPDQISSQIWTLALILGDITLSLSYPSSYPLSFLPFSFLLQELLIFMNVFLPRSPKRAYLVYKVMLKSYVLFLSPHFIRQLHKLCEYSQGRSSFLALNSQHTSCSATLDIQFETVTRKRDHPLDLALVHALVSVLVRNKWHLSNLESFKPSLFCAE